MFPDRDVRRGIADTIPLLVPVVPFALVIGLTIAESPLPNLVGWLGASFIFGGAAQLTLVTLAAEGAGLLAVIVAGLVVNARHFVYSVALSPSFGPQPTWFRWLGPYFLIDQEFALAIFRVDDPPGSFRRYYLASGITFWCTWQVTVALGLVVGPVIPERWSLEFAVPLMFLGLVLGAMKAAPAVVAALTGALVSWLALGIPNRGGILAGTAAGILAGVMAERWRR